MPAQRHVLGDIEPVSSINSNIFKRANILDIFSCVLPSSLRCAALLLLSLLFTSRPCPSRPSHSAPPPNKMRKALTRSPDSPPAFGDRACRCRTRRGRPDSRLAHLTQHPGHVQWLRRSTYRSERSSRENFEEVGQTLSRADVGRRRARYHVRHGCGAVVEGVRAGVVVGVVVLRSPRQEVPTVDGAANLTLANRALLCVHGPCLSLTVLGFRYLRSPTLCRHIIETAA